MPAVSLRWYADLDAGLRLFSGALCFRAFAKNHAPTLPADEVLAAR